MSSHRKRTLMRLRADYADLATARDKMFTSSTGFQTPGPPDLRVWRKSLSAQRSTSSLQRGAQATRAARRATGVIPIVMSPATDPVGNGFVANLAQPGGNITGMGLFNWELIGKRVQLLREIIPTVARVAVLFNQNNPAPVGVWEASLAAAASIGIGLRQLAVRTSADFEPTFAKIASERFGALVVVQSPLFDTPPYRIVQLAAAIRLPTVYGLRLLTEAGGLVSYGPNVAELYGQAATFVAKILRGAKPADLPVEQPTKIELVVNLKTSRELGLVIPQSVLLRADDVLT